MSYLGHIPNNDLWIAQLFGSKSAMTGGVVRRKRADVDRKIGPGRLELEVRRRGFRLLEAGDQYIVVCTQDPVRVLV